MRTVLLLALSSLVACSGGDKPAAKPAEPAKPVAPPPSTELNVYIWTNYHSPDQIKKFEEAHHAKVNIDLYDNKPKLKEMHGKEMPKSVLGDHSVSPSPAVSGRMQVKRSLRWRTIWRYERLEKGQPCTSRSGGPLPIAL